MTRFLITILAFTLLASQAVAQTKPARDVSNLEKWFKQLDDKDPEARDAARTLLMGIPRSRLDDLQTVVRDARPLSAAQAVELRQIVSHVFLTGLPYPINRDFRSSGFLGVRLALVRLPDAGGDEVNVTNVSRRVVIESRLPGFSAYPVLRDGDVIERIYIDDHRGVVPHEINDLANVVSAMEAGRVLDIEVQRAGKLMRLTVKLSPRPTTDLVDQRQRGAEFLQQRDSAAAEYWEQTFAKLLNQRTT